MNFEKTDGPFCAQRSAMKVVGLVSGGKDSCFNLIKCVEHGHEIVALAHLQPPAQIGMRGLCSPLPLTRLQAEMDSYMYQTVGSEMIDAYSQCMSVPLFKRVIERKSVCTTMAYERNDQDEVEDLYLLLKQVLVSACRRGRVHRRLEMARAHCCFRLSRPTRRQPFQTSLGCHAELYCPLISVSEWKMCA